MCESCIEKQCPDRGTTVLEVGTFLLNMKACSDCGERQILNTDRLQNQDSDGLETITYTHKCKSCQHVVARHRYTFSVEDGFQEYSMQCSLCGHASDTRSVMPDDPRHQATLY